MKILSLSALAILAAGTAACQGSTNNSASANDAVSTTDNSVTINGAAVGESLENGLSDVGNVASNAGEAIGNGLDKAGDAIENTARGAVGEVREETREERIEANVSTNAAR